MYDHHCKDCENLEYCMKMMNMPMMNMPMMNMPMYEEDDKDLKKMYPKLYTKIYPLIKYHCDMMESMHGSMYCPSKEELDHICKEVCDKYEEHDKDDDDYDRNENNDKRQILGGRRGITQDLIRILLIRNLLGRRRRRRRRRPHYGY